MEAFADTIAGTTVDLYPKLHSRRASAAVHRKGGPAEGPGTYIAYTYDEGVQVLRDAETFSSTVVREMYEAVMGKDVIVGMDEPEHGRHRALVSPAFRPRVLARWEDELVAIVVDELLDGLAGPARSTDLVRDLTGQFPVRVIARILGLPDGDHDRFLAWGMAIINVAADWSRGVDASAQLVGYLDSLIEERRREPRDDLLSDLATSEIDGERLRDEEIHSFVQLLLPAGVETTYRSSGSLLFGLLTNPDQMALLRGDPSLGAQAVEEALRWEPPVLITTRVSTRDVELAGVAIPAGSRVIVHLGAANRDPSRWVDPDRFDIARELRPNLAFGFGPHVCLGMHLARMETSVALNGLLDRLPNLRLDPEGDDPHVTGMTFRSPTSLPVLFG